MSAVRRIAQNTFILIATQVVVAALGLVYGICAARHLGPDSFGVLTFAISLSSLASMLFGSGLSPLTLREVAANLSVAPRYLANGTLLRLAMAAAALVVVSLYAHLMDYPSKTVLVVVLLSLATACRAAAEIPYSLFRAFELVHYISVGQILSSLLLLAGLGLALVHDFDVVGFAWLYVAANGLTLIYVAAAVTWRFFLFQRRPPHLCRSDMRIALSALRGIRAAAFPFAIATVGLASLHYTDTIILSAMVPDSDKLVGYYNAAYRLVDMVVAFEGALLISVTPAVVQAYTISRPMLTFISGRLFKYLLIIALPIGVGTTLLAERFVLTIYGPDYREATIALQILIWSFVIAAVNIFPLIFQAMGRARTAAIVVLSVAVLNIILNLVLIPRYDYVAAAATTVAAIAIGLVTFYILYSRTNYHFGLAHVTGVLTRVMPATAAMGLVVWFLPRWHLALTVPLAAVVYFAVLALLRTFDGDDMRLLASLISNRPLSPVAGSVKAKKDASER